MKKQKNMFHFSTTTMSLDKGFLSTLQYQVTSLLMCTGFTIKAWGAAEPTPNPTTTDENELSDLRDTRLEAQCLHPYFSPQLINEGNYLASKSTRGAAAYAASGMLQLIPTWTFVAASNIFPDDWKYNFSSLRKSFFVFLIWHEMHALLILIACSLQFATVRKHTIAKRMAN